MLTSVNREDNMTKTDWDKVAKKQFDSMDADAQAQWSDLRKRLMI